MLCNRSIIYWCTKNQKNGFAGNYFFKPMTNSEHMPHSPTPTYADIECRQQSAFYISGWWFQLKQLTREGSDTWHIWPYQEEVSLTSWVRSGIWLGPAPSAASTDKLIYAAWKESEPGMTFTDVIDI